MDAESVNADGSCSRRVECEPCKERVDQLMQALELPVAKLTGGQFEQLQGLIRMFLPLICPSNPWASPVVLVPKKDGKLRFCRCLNSITRKDVYPIDDILDALGKTSYFSSLDLASGYWQVELDEGSRQKSAFTTHWGLFEFTHMPFGLCNAPATFQRLMTQVLANLE